MEVINKIDLLIMEEIIKDLTRKWSINELSKRIKKHYKPVYLSVQRLIKNQIMTKNDNDLIEPIYKNTLVLENSEKSRLSKLKDKKILIIKEKINKNVNSSFFTLILFGSSVHKKGKDIDLLCIIPDSEDIERFNKELKIALGPLYLKADLNVINEKSCYEMLNRPNEFNVMNEIMKNHLVIIGVENFYRIIKKWKND